MSGEQPARFRSVKSFDGQHLVLAAQEGQDDACGSGESYEIGTFLGGGAAGVVYEAVETASQQVSAALPGPGCSG